MLPFAAAQGVSTFSRRPVSLSNQAANSRVVNHDPPIERKNAFPASTGPCPSNPTFAITGLAPSTCTLLAFLDSFSRVSFFFRNTAFSNSSILFQQKRERERVLNFIIYNNLCDSSVKKEFVEIVR